MLHSKTHILMLALPLLLQVIFLSCSGNTFIGDPDGIEAKRPSISFGGKTGELTRATGPEAAAALNNSFVVFGFKTKGDVPETVFDHYTVSYTAGSDHTTQSNSAGWEYVGQPLSAVSTLPAGAEQSIKYWDFSADSYDFIAFSAGTAELVNTEDEIESGKVYATSVTPTSTPVSPDTYTGPKYTITGASADLVKVFIADRVTAGNAPASTVPNRLVAYKDAIQFAFKPLAAKVRIGLYETIPGYSVKDVRFYQEPGSTDGAVTPYLYAGTQTIPSGKGIVNVSFPVTDPAAANYNRVVATYDSEGEKTQTLTLGALAANAAKEGKENGGNIYLGRTSSAASMTADILVVPAPASDLTLKIDFTLVSIDYNETIHVKGALATISAQYTNWQPNYAYTYIFKISDMVANAFGQVLYPITFDALETVTDNGLQQTITTIDQPSITTYAKGELGSDYYEGDHIYVAVTNGNPRVLTTENSKLYTVSLKGSAQPKDITEKNLIDNQDAIAAGTYELFSLTDASSMLTITNTIDPEDSSTGDRITADHNYFAKFTAGDNTYVFEFTDDNPVLYQTAEEYNTDKGTSLTEQEFAALTNEQKIKAPAGKHYKVIRVQAGPRP